MSMSTYYYTSKKRLYLDRTGTRIVEENDPDVGFLLCPAGGQITTERAKALGLLDEPAPAPVAVKAVEPEPEPEPEGEGEPKAEGEAEPKTETKEIHKEQLSDKSVAAAPATKAKTKK